MPRGRERPPTGVIVPPLVVRARGVAEALGFSGSCTDEDGALLHVLAARRGILRVGEIGIELGDARQRGETHQWMYDAENLSALLESCGFSDVAVVAFDLSRIQGWDAYGLDVNENGGQYKPDSLYVEAVKSQGAAR